MNYLNFIGSSVTINSRKWGKIKVESASFTPAVDGDLVVIIGEPFKSQMPYVRIHSECVFAEVFDSDFCDCADQFKLAMDFLSQKKDGILFYLRFDGRGAGLSAKVEATKLEMLGIDTYESRLQIGVEPEGRIFTNIGRYLTNKGVQRITLLTNSSQKVNDIKSTGIDVIMQNLYIENPNNNVDKLYKTKVNKFNHSIPGYSD